MKKINLLLLSLSAMILVGCSSGGLSGTYYKADLLSGEIEDEDRWIKSSGSKVTYHRSEDTEYQYKYSTKKDGEDTWITLVSEEDNEDSCRMYTGSDNKKLIYFGPGCFDLGDYAFAKK